MLEGDRKELFKYYSKGKLSGLEYSRALRGNIVRSLNALKKKGLIDESKYNFGLRQIRRNEITSLGNSGDIRSKAAVVAIEYENMQALRENAASNIRSGRSLPLKSRGGIFG